MDNKIRCRTCKSENVVKRGTSPTKLRGVQQRYLCKDCHKTFIPDLGFWKMKNHENKVTKAIDVYFSNLSSRKVRDFFYRHEETKVSHVSVLDWCRKYVLKVQKYIDTLKPQLLGRVYADETEIDREKNHNDIFWCSVDWDTRYINATLYSPHSQNMEDATEFMHRIKQKGVPKYIQTDGLPFYPSAFSKVFGQGKRKYDLRTEHRVNNVSKTKKHNVRIETVFSKIKDRVYDFRGLKALWSAPILLAGIVLQHNFIQKHTTTKAFPCELAGLQLETGVNRWLGIIRLSAEV
ncbi:IS1/IS6 family transposase [Candidatus Woesearchaeota archaeon]|nr:IS1/IS6 family transposase [Candidatus Woesearchaeota archaeon]